MRILRTSTVRFQGRIEVQSFNEGRKEKESEIPGRAAARRKAKAVAGIVDMCRRFDNRRESASPFEDWSHLRALQSFPTAKCFPGKCQSLSFFMIRRGIVWTSMWIESRGRAKMPLITCEFGLALKVLLSKVRTDTESGGKADARQGT
jgi:hypothetical protein